MIVKTYCAALSGLDGNIVTIETDVSFGMPRFDMVGLPDASVKESRERVRSAILNSGFEFSAHRIVINLAPADLKKEGTQYDLPIAVSILASTNQIKADTDSCMLLGELGLSGELRGVSGILSSVLCARNSGFKSVIVPVENAREAALVDGIEVYGAQSLAQAVLHLAGEESLPKTDCIAEEVFSASGSFDVDFCQVRGQLALRRGVEVATAGGHNLLLIGSPGSGKSMIAQRIPTILPDMTVDEALEVTRIYSVAGELKNGTFVISNRPFRSPHHSASLVSIVGGGTHPKPGEISLAHNGVLFLDEFPEYSKSVMEAMRQPLEDKTVTVSRAAASCTYPCNVMLVAAMNPCRCGYYGDGSGRCHCSQTDVRRYLGKVSGPLLDRIDIQLEALPLRYNDLQDKKGECSSDIKARVNAARKIQQQRFKSDGITCNAQMNAAHIEKYCPLGKEEHEMLKNVFDVMGLSARAYSRILKVARTVADLDGRAQISCMDITEAVGYRNLDRKYWN